MSRALAEMSAWCTEPFDKQKLESSLVSTGVAAFVPVEVNLSKSFTPLHQKKCWFILTDKGPVVYFESSLLIQIVSKAPNVLSFATNSPQQMDYCIYAAANQLFYEISRPIFKTKHGIPYFFEEFFKVQRGPLGFGGTDGLLGKKRDTANIYLLRLIHNKNIYRGTVFIQSALSPSLLTPVYQHNFLSCAETLHDMYLSLPKRLINHNPRVKSVKKQSAYKWQGNIKHVGKNATWIIMKAEPCLETMTPVGRNDSTCRNVFSLPLNDSRLAAVLIGLARAPRQRGRARANVIIRTPKPQTTHDLEYGGGRLSAAPMRFGCSIILPMAFLFFLFFFLRHYATENKRQLWEASCSAAPVLESLLGWNVYLCWKSNGSLSSRSVYAGYLY